MTEEVVLMESLRSEMFFWGHSKIWKWVPLYCISWETALWIPLDHWSEVPYFLRGGLRGLLFSQLIQLLQLIAVIMNHSINLPQLVHEFSPTSSHKLG